MDWQKFIILTLTIVTAIPFFCACGKKIEEDKKAENVITPIKTDSPEPFILEHRVDSSQNTDKQILVYTLERNGEMQLPLTIAVTEGTNFKREVRIKVNVKNNLEEMYCVYVPFEFEFKFKDCYNPAHLALNIDIRTFDFFLDEGKEIHIQIRKLMTDVNPTAIRIQATAIWDF